MQLTPPKRIVFYISLLLAVLAIVEYFTDLPLVGGYEFWLAFVAYVLLAAGNAVKGF